ncbi:MAG: hypothetical protein K8T90_03610 [Planctomycetes bacterium]|nr:hypothetical protein [Planctomycetota bacterium]
MTPPNPPTRPSVRRAFPSVPGAIVAAMLATVALASGLAACNSTKTERRSAVEDLGDKRDVALRVLATGETQGYLETCGCESGQIGGIARRGTYLRGLRGPNDLTIDLGNITSGSGDLRRLRREAALDALAALKYDVVVPGRGEIVDGEAFVSGAKARGLRVVSANVTGPDGNPLFEPWWVRVLPDGRRVAVIGLTEPIALPPAGWHVTPPVAALVSALHDLEGKADTVIVATSLPEPDARAIAESAEGVSLVLAGATPDPDVTFDAAGRALLGVVGHLGQYVSRIDFDASLKPAFTWRAWLDEKVPEDTEMAAIIRRYKDDVAGLDTQFVDKIVAAKRAASFAGSKSCESCHGADYAVWKASLHGNAMRILVEKKANRDPDCVPCHLVDVPHAPTATVAAGTPGALGAVTATGTFDADAMGVGCEACHGGSAAHVADPKVRTPNRDGGRSLCVSACHHPPEVKTFDVAKQWEKVRHGGK